MNNETADNRVSLLPGDKITTRIGTSYIVDRLITRGGLSLMYLAHKEGESSFFALKELYPVNSESVICYRDGTGRIIFANQNAGSATDDRTLRKYYYEFFFHEKRLTEQARLVSTDDGYALQNNADVLSMEGPFIDQRGNLFLSIETNEGKTMRDIMEESFEREENGWRVCGKVAYIFRLFLKALSLLDRLQKNNKILHLDLSPDNIYFSFTEGGREISPHIIDFGSAICDLDQDMNYYHRYSRNAYSAPEIRALAELNDSECGYSAGAYSDTFSLAAMLFGAMTGKTYTPEMDMFQDGWKGHLLSAYNYVDTNVSDPFTKKLISFFEKGLNADPLSRYQDAHEMLNALSSLADAFIEAPSVLSNVEKNELLSFVLLSKYPLYRYISGDGNLHITCIGSGDFLKNAILNLISCGQMMDRNVHLILHIVSSMTSAQWKDCLTKSAPELAVYSDIICDSEVNNDKHFVSFSFHDIGDCIGPGNPFRSDDIVYMSRLYLVSPGAESRANGFQIAQLIKRKLAEADDNHLRTICCAVDNDEYMRQNHAIEEGKTNVRVDFFSLDSSQHRKQIEIIGNRARKLSFQYDRIANKMISSTESGLRFADDGYGQSSSCASILHISAKLFGLGIDPDSSVEEICNTYPKTASEHLGELIELEHRRWLMYMVAHGYRFADSDMLIKYAYETVDGHFVDKWRFTIGGVPFHNCLIPCGTGDTLLEDCPSEIWDGFDSVEQINDSLYDDLDKASLLAHLIAKNKALSVLRSRQLHNRFDEIRYKLNNAIQPTDNAMGNSSASQQISKVKSLFSLVEGQIIAQASSLQYKGDNGLLSRLADNSQECGVNISQEVSALKQCLSVFLEYSRYRDFKAGDLTVIHSLPWIMSSADSVTLVKLKGKSIMDDYAGALLIDPQNFIIVGTQRDKLDDSCLQVLRYKNRVKYTIIDDDNPEKVLMVILNLAKSHNNNIVIDITGADSAISAGITMLLERNANCYSHVSVTASSISDSMSVSMLNVWNFPSASSYRLTTELSAEEIFSMYGAERIQPTEEYMHQLFPLVPTLWQFYEKHKTQWEMLSSFFAVHQFSDDLRLTNLVIANDTEWSQFTYSNISKWDFDHSNIDGAFVELAQKGLIRDYKSHSGIGNSVTVSFSYPEDGSKRVRNAIYGLLQHLSSSIAPYQWQIDVKGGTYSVRIFNGYKVFVHNPTSFRNANGKVFAYSDVYPLLQELSDLGLIALMDNLEKPGAISRLTFYYTDSAIRTFFAKAGNILELYVWYEAVQSGFFFDCSPNFAFHWKGKSVSNELDVVLTHGLRSILISCKTAKFSKEHLYEIDDLTRHFSFNSIPVIVYSSTLAISESGHLSSDLSPVTERAKAMGIYLIDLNELRRDNISLGKRLVDIAEGKITL